MVVFYLITRKNTIRKCIFSHSFLIEGLGRPAPGTERKGINVCGFKMIKARSRSARGFHHHHRRGGHQLFRRKGDGSRSKKDGLVHLLRSESMAKGVRVIFEEDDTVSIELHIIVDAGVNLTAVSSSIMSEVRYAVGNMTGAQVRAVDVYVDSMEID